jgi:hypothetical protein
MKKRFFTELDQIPEPAEERDICMYAQRFEVWARQLCEEHQSSVVTINQAKVLLLDKYFEWRAYVPRQHRNRVSENSHHCIWHVFEERYRTLRLVELSINGPMLFLPPPPAPPLPPPPPPQIAGIFIGEVDDE